MAKNKIDRDELEKMVKKLNKLDIADEIDLDDFEGEDDEDLAEAFMDAVKEIADKKKEDKIPKKVVEFNNKLYDILEGGGDKDKDPDDEDGGNEDLEDDLKGMDYKEFKKFVKENDLKDKLETELKKGSFGKKKKKLVKEVVELMSKSGSDSSDDENEEVDLDKLEEKLDEMDFDDFEEWAEKNLPDFEVDEDEWDDDKEDVIEKVIKLMKKAQKKNGKKDKDKKEDKKDKKEKKDKESGGKSTDKSPFRDGSNQAVFYEKIEEGDCKVSDLAVILNKGKKKESEKKWNAVVHMLARKYGDKAPVCITFSGKTVGEGVVTHSE